MCATKHVRACPRLVVCRMHPSTDVSASAYATPARCMPSAVPKRAGVNKALMEWHFNASRTAAHSVAQCDTCHVLAFTVFPL
jgi:hypothetical protein